MKKIISFAISLALVFCSHIPPVKAADEAALPEKCEHCGVAVTWTPLSREDIRDTASLTTGHYYVAMEEDSYDSVVKRINADQTVCLYLNGKTLAGTTRGLDIKEGGTLNIMGEGRIIGRGTTAGVDGACCTIAKGGTLNQYGGTLSYVTYLQRHATNGGVVYVNGTFNLYDGVVENGITKQYHGGNIYVGDTGEFNMYGGEVRNGTAEYAGGNIYVHATGILRQLGGSITGGTAKVAGDCVYNRGTVILSGDSNCDGYFLNPNTGAGGPAYGDMIQIDGDFSGEAAIEINSPSTGMDIGNAPEGVISGKLYVLDSMCCGEIRDGNIVLVTSGYCEHCKTNVTWEALDPAATNLNSGHYYAAANITGYPTQYVPVNRSICLNLNGKTVKSDTRPFTVYPGGVLNIMGGGKLVGSGSSEKYPNGGVINVVAEGTVNLYSGTLAFEASADAAIRVQNGGTVNVAGDFNMYGGKIDAGIATNAGGTVFVSTTGVLSVFGGEIAMGKMGTTNSCIYNRGTVNLSGDPVIADLFQKPNVEDGGPALSDMLVIRGTFGGSLTLRGSGITTGVDIGTIEGTVSNSAVTKIAGTSTLKFCALGRDLTVRRTENAIVYAADGTVTGYADLSAAVAAVSGLEDKIVLFADVTEPVTLDKDVLVDLNGYHITGGFDGGKTVYCQDVHTDDYTISDGIYGSAVPGNCVLVAADGYHAVADQGTYSFHRLSFDITSMSLRPSEVGLYLSATFAGDELVSTQIESFGVVLNAYDEPCEENMQTTSLYTDYPAGRWVCGQTTTATGTLLRGIMDQNIDTQTNQLRAKTLVFGKAYIKTAEGYSFSDLILLDLQSILEQADTQWSELTGMQKKTSLSMYNTYLAEMDSWEIPNLKQEKADNDRYATVDATASQEDIRRLGAFYEGTQAYHGELHDHSASGGRSDGKQPLDIWLAYMEYLDMDFAAIVDHKQVRHMYLPEWQSGVFIGGTEAATTVKELGMSMHYNMMFTDPESLIAILEEFPEFKYTGGDPLTAYFPYYPSFDRARIAELITAIREKGGMFTHVHPASGNYINSDDPLDYWFADWTGFEVITVSREHQCTENNYKVWLGLLELGKKVWATTGRDDHDMPSDKVLSTVYARSSNAAGYFDPVKVGNFAAGPVGIKMSVGDAVMGSEGSFAGKRVVFSVGDFHKSVYDPQHTYRVDLISDAGVVFSKEISCTDTAYFACDAENVRFYRVEVWDTSTNSRLCIGNPVWNTDPSQ